MNKQYNRILEAINRGIQIALDDYQDIETNNSISQYNDVINSEENIKNLIELNKYTVDLGLPSGTRWCKYNLGVDIEKVLKSIKSYDDLYGDYYAWGETQTKDNEIETNVYSIQNYKLANGEHNKLTKYCNNARYGNNGYIDNLKQLLPEDDAAYQNMSFYNFKFKTPTEEQFIELIRYTTNKWVTDYQGITGSNGVIFISKNGNELFFPAAGSYDYRGFLDGSGKRGYYFSSTISDEFPTHANYLGIDKDRTIKYNLSRWYGVSIRPVLA